MEDAADICFVLPFSNRLSNWKAQHADSFRCTAAIKRPILTNMLIGGVALCATLFALQQLVTGQGNPFALLCTVLLIIMLARSRVIWRSKKR